MKLSKNFANPTKTDIGESESLNYQLLTRAGFISQLMAGAYSFLPLGLKVLTKIEQVVRQEMDQIGGLEILMPILHPKANWQTTGGWDSIDVLFKLKSRTGNDYALGQSEEEIVTPLVLGHIQSYKQLPVAVYQIHWKYRDELRAKSGLLRGREFYMKDMYSFHADQKDFDRFYQVVKEAYLKIYDRLGLVAKVTEASGGAFSEKISYEFMVLTDAGEDDILYCDDCDFCVNVEIAQEKKGDKCPRCSRATLKEARASEVGNIFDLGQKYGKDFSLSFVDENNSQRFPVMGCYGIGISRLMGVIVEKHNDQAGIIWPQSVAPAQIHLIRLGDDEAVIKTADKLYQQLIEAGRAVVYDDRDESAGVKFADADLIGLPERWTISAKTLAENSVEVKRRMANESKLVKLDKVLAS
jgi:prolyl-tRNA synthetase